MKSCGECKGVGYAMTGGKCRSCLATGRAHVRCADCRGGFRFVEGFATGCPTCAGYGLLDEARDARAIDMQRERLAAAGVPRDTRRIPREAPQRRRVTPAEGATETRLERDEDAELAAREAWAGHEASQVRRSRRSRAA